MEFVIWYAAQNAGSVKGIAASQFNSGITAAGITFSEFDAAYTTEI